MTERRQRRWTAGLFVTLLILATFLAASCFRLPSDEKVLRRAFSIPADVRLVSLDAPTPGGWFGREGLEITAVFSFEPNQFDDYRREARDTGHWKPMPIEREFLLRILGVRSHRAALKRMNEEYRTQGMDQFVREIPTEDDVLALWAAPRLPLDVDHGMFCCLTAGTNLMHAIKRDCAKKSGDLNDFMLAVLDEDRRQLRVKAHTAY